MIDTLLITRLENSLRDGEARLKNPKTRNEGVARAVRNTRIRISRAKAGLPVGSVVWNGDSWQYEFGE